MQCPSLPAPLFLSIGRMGAMRVCPHLRHLMDNNNLVLAAVPSQATLTQWMLAKHAASDKNTGPLIRGLGIGHNRSLRPHHFGYTAVSELSGVTDRTNVRTWRQGLTGRWSIGIFLAEFPMLPLCYLPIGLKQCFVWGSFHAHPPGNWQDFIHQPGPHNGSYVYQFLTASHHPVEGTKGQG